mgnify:CR=1 FL=1
MTERQAVRWMDSAAGRWEKRLTRAWEGRPLPWAGLGLALWRLGKGKSLAARLAAFLLAGGLTALLGRARP